MSIIVAWYDPHQSAILIESSGSWSWDEFNAAVDDTFAMIESQPHPVGLIIHRSGESRMPPGNPMLHYQRMIRDMPRNTSRIAIVSPNPFARTITNVFLQVNTQLAAQVVFVPSAEDAYALLSAARPA